MESLELIAELRKDNEKLKSLLRAAATDAHHAYFRLHGVDHGSQYFQQCNHFLCVMYRDASAGFSQKTYNIRDVVWNG